MSKIIEDAAFNDLYQYLLKSCDGSENTEEYGKFLHLLQRPKCIPEIATLALKEVYSKRFEALKAHYFIACAVENIRNPELTERCAKMISDFAVHDDDCAERISRDDKENLHKISAALKGGVRMESLVSELFPSSVPKVVGGAGG